MPKRRPRRLKRISSKKIREFHSKLKVLQNSSPKERQSLLKKESYLTCVSQCACNIVKGNVPVSGARRARLARHKSGLRRLIKTKSAVGKRRVLKGGLLGAILSAAIPVLGSLIGGLVGRK